MMKPPAAIKRRPMLGLLIALAILAACQLFSVSALGQGGLFAPQEQVTGQQGPTETSPGPQSGFPGQPSQAGSKGGYELPAGAPSYRDTGQPVWPSQAASETQASPAGQPMSQGQAESQGQAGPAQEEGGLGLFSPPPPPPPTPPPTPPKPITTEKAEFAGEVLQYYMFTDDQGVTHLTDAPVDPRYRLFTIAISVTSNKAPYRRLDLERLRPYIQKASNTYKVDQALITAIVKAESAFDPNAVSWAGARGLMQLMPATARMMGVKDSFDPEQNIMGGTRYLRMMLNRFSGNVILAVAAYNCGPERVARVMAVPEIRETKNYVKTVLRNYETFLRLFSTEATGKAD